MDSIIIFCSKYLVFILPILLIWVGYKLPPSKRLKYALTIAVASVIGVTLAKIGDKLYYHPRPFVTSGVAPLIEHGTDNGFPSEHSTYAMTIAGVIYLYKKQLGYYAAAIAVVVGFGRVFAHVHSMLDILAGVAIGIVAVWSANYILSKYYKTPSAVNHRKKH
jgi:undecaprenyl-diphosphatase